MIVKVYLNLFRYLNLFIYFNLSQNVLLLAADAATAGVEVEQSFYFGQAALIWPKMETTIK